jgi:hypothetical protein
MLDAYEGSVDANVVARFILEGPQLPPIAVAASNSQRPMPLP